jgi:hypothetical protein
MNTKFLRTGEPRASASGDLRYCVPLALPVDISAEVRHWQSQWHPRGVLRALTLPARLGGLLMLLLNPCFAGPVSSFEDILSWNGTGNNRSALVLDWQGDSTADHALVWGYRWDGTRKGSNLLLDIVAADPRLYAKVGSFGGYGVAVFGLGYDANADGAFALDDGTAFAGDGIAQVSGPEEGASSMDPADWYAEGWLLSGYWHYGVAASSPYAGGTWTNAVGGISSHSLANGSWDTLAFSPTYSALAFGQNPIAALPATDADFNADGQVDGGDFLQWQRGFGISTGATLVDGDADGDGDVDASDLGYWQTDYGTGSSSLITAYAAVPEPSGVLFILITSCLSGFRLASLKKGSV